jgi:hypothetical protein
MIQCWIAGSVHGLNTEENYKNSISSSQSKRQWLKALLKLFELSNTCFVHDLTWMSHCGMLDNLQLSNYITTLKLKDRLLAPLLHFSFNLVSYCPALELLFQVHCPPSDDGSIASFGTQP